MANVKEIVIEYLKREGYGGLVTEDGCGCLAEWLAIRERRRRTLEAAIKKDGVTMYAPHAAETLKYDYSDLNIHLHSWDQAESWRGRKENKTLHLSDHAKRCHDEALILSQDYEQYRVMFESKSRGSQTNFRSFFELIRAPLECVWSASEM